MLTTRERVTKGLDLLTEGLCSFVEGELKAVYRDDWIRAARTSFREDRAQILPKGEVVRWDAHALLTVMWDQWNSVFRHSLGQVERSLVCELRDSRNRWAHQQEFAFDDAYRILDSIERLLRVTGSPSAETVQHEKRELLRDELAEEVNADVSLRETTREKRTVVTVYVLCGTVMIAQTIYAWGLDAWALVVALLSFFGYLIYKKLRIETPQLGPHECRECRKIIYTDACPYCVLNRQPAMCAENE